MLPAPADHEGSTPRIDMLLKINVGLIEWISIGFPPSIEAVSEVAGRVKSA